METNHIFKAIADNPALFKAVKEAVLAEFDIDEISLWVKGTVGLDDKRLGEIVRARLEGKNKIEEAFRKIASYKSIPDTPERVNRAR